MSVGLAIMRIQPMHNGHCRIIDRMIRNNDTVILGIGSTQVQREQWNPWTFEERKKMVHNVYGDRVKIIQLKDLGTTAKTNDWIDYAMDKIKKVGLPEPTDYYTGSTADSRFYCGRFLLEEKTLHDVDVYNVEDYLSNNGVARRLHIVERASRDIPPATDLRTFLELRSDEWKQWVPRVNWEVVEKNFPEEFKIKG